jgi:hypothetical protein
MPAGNPKPRGGAVWYKHCKPCQCSNLCQMMRINVHMTSTYPDQSACFSHAATLPISWRMPKVHLPSSRHMKAPTRSAAVRRLLRGPPAPPCCCCCGGGGGSGSGGGGAVAQRALLWGPLAASLCGRPPAAAPASAFTPGSSFTAAGPCSCLTSAAPWSRCCCPSSAAAVAAACCFPLRRCFLAPRPRPLLAPGSSLTSSSSAAAAAASCAARLAAALALRAAARALAACTMATSSSSAARNPSTCPSSP